MDKTLLVGPDLEEGRKFVDLLISSGIPLKAALWLKIDEFPQLICLTFLSTRRNLISTRISAVTCAAHGIVTS